jgi:hypothetical protein
VRQHQRDQQRSEAGSIHDGVADGRAHDVEGAWKTMTNEDAGTPSSLGTLPANDPLFATLSKERMLVLVVGPSRQQVPLRDIGDKADRFSRLCQKQ